MDFQRECNEALADNRSLLVVAPTGLGKTRAAIAQATATDGGLLGTRTVYTLPMRALASGIKKEMDDLLGQNHRNWQARIHHGQLPDSETFRERAIITTIDQYLTSFAGAPLSFTSRDGHSAAGALLTSYSVFDEVHLLDPRAGLPLLFAAVRQRQNWGLLSCIMTATLPQCLIAHFEKYLDLTVVRASLPDALYRDSRRRVTLHYAEDVAPDPADRLLAVMEAFEKHGRVIAFCNTVPSALKLFDALSGEVGRENVVLAHSRFAPTHRMARDWEVSDRFGKNGTGGILVTTQVAEAGLNISAPAVFSELAPADSLIQRAGRCARFFRDPTLEIPLRGSFTVWPLNNLADKAGKLDEKMCLPYDLGVMESTLKAIIEDLDGEILDWEREQNFVNRSLSDFYAAFVGDQDLTKSEREARRKSGEPLPKHAAPLTPVTALGAFERAFQAGDASQVEKLLRESITVNVGVVGDFEAAQNAYNTPETDADGKPCPRIYPQTVSLRLSTFADLRKKNEWQVREVVVTHKVKRGDGEKSDDGRPMKLTPVQRLRPGGTYFILASEAGYSAKTGLGISKQAGESTPTKEIPARERGQRQQDGRLQTWEGHALGAHWEAQRILGHYRPFLVAWAGRVFAHIEMSAEDMADALLEAMGLAVLLHDVGKLNDAWQTAVGRRHGVPLARTPNKHKAPYHAQFVFPLLKNLLYVEAGEHYRLYDHIALAAARHHVLTLDGDIAAGQFTWTPGGKEAVRNVVRAVFGVDAPSSLKGDEVLDGLEQLCHAGEAPGPSADDYFVYCLTNRLVKYSDICDAGAGPLELTAGQSDEADTENKPG